MTTNQPSATHTAAERIARQHLLGDVTDNTRPWSCSCGESFRTNRQWSTHVIVIALAASRAVPSGQREALLRYAQGLVDGMAQRPEVVASDAAHAIRKLLGESQPPSVPSDHAAARPNPTSTDDSRTGGTGRTPRTSTVRAGWARGHPFAQVTDPDERGAEFDRWLARLLATARPDTTEAQAQALEAAAYELDAIGLIGEKPEKDCTPEQIQAFTAWANSTTEDWLRDRAAAIREGADQ